MMGSATIEDLPDVIIEYIFCYLSPYRDLKSCKLVNKSWYFHSQAAARTMQRNFYNAILNQNVQWCHLLAEPGPTISKRYSHSACICGDSMYVFGGCTTANTTFNDLWRLDLATRRWIRPLAMGTYPPPKACASLVCFQDTLLLFGGWTHTSPYPLHQTWRIFKHLHVYNSASNRWTQIATVGGCPAMAGHSATLQGTLMVVFGGLHCLNIGGPFTNSNEVWVLDLKTYAWKKQETSDPKPRPRYGHSQISMDKHHLLIIGGCGGPNMLLNDIWLLTIPENIDEQWQWKEILVKNRDSAAPQLSFHPACKVGDRVVVLSKAKHGRTSPSSLHQLLRTPSRTWIPPRPENGHRTSTVEPQKSTEEEPCINGKRGVLKRHFGKTSEPLASNLTSSSDDDDSSSCARQQKKVASSSTSHESSFSKGFDSGNPGHSSSVTVCTENIDMPSSSSSSPSSSSVVASAPAEASPSSPEGSLPKSNAQQETPSENCGTLSKSVPNKSPRPVLSIRPNARRNRQRQLEGLDRMEQRLRNLRAGSPQNTKQQGTTKRGVSSVSSYHARSPMCLYVLDISEVTTNSTATWLPQRIQEGSTLEEVILYSLMLGRGELIMFGGIQKDLNSPHQDSDSVSEIVSSSLHFITCKRNVI